MSSFGVDTDAVWNILIEGKLFLNIKIKMFFNLLFLNGSAQSALFSLE